MDASTWLAASGVDAHALAVTLYALLVAVGLFILARIILVLFEAVTAGHLKSARACSVGLQAVAALLVLMLVFRPSSS